MELTAGWLVDWLATFNTAQSEEQVPTTVSWAIEIRNAMHTQPPYAHCTAGGFHEILTSFYTILQ